MRRNAEAAPNDRASVDLPEKNVKSRTTEARGVPIELPEEALAKFEAVTAAMPEIKKARRIREIDAAMEKGMSGFEERTADIVLEKQRIALAREADSRANAIRERFKDARAPHDDAWEFLLELRKYEFELEEALEEARENSGLRDARKDIEALAAARKNVRDAIREIRSAVEKKEKTRGPLTLPRRTRPISGSMRRSGENLSAARSTRTAAENSKTNSSAAPNKSKMRS
jgi:hypothetical protein